MYLKKPSWQLSQNDVTDENLFNNRRHFLKLGAATAISTSAITELLASDYANELLYKKDSSDLVLNSFKQISSYNNFYEFGLDKDSPAELAHTIRTEGWKVEIGGEVAKPLTLDIDDIMKRFALEERIYRFRCVEAWSMVIPWIGFKLSDLIKLANPNSKAKYVAFQTKYDESMFPQQKNPSWGNVPFPYVEGLRLDEAMNELTLLAVGLYGKHLPKQNGAPIRLVVPWKYGFKSIKSIDKITFTEHEPPTTWNKLASHEYGFYANVNPEVDHPRWSQAKERRIGSFFKIPTKMFNGYEKEVASLYSGMDLRKFY